MVLIGPSSLAHSGVKGMKHGVRQYQNRDGTWTELGKERRRNGEARVGSKMSSLTKEDYDAAKKAYKKYDKLYPKPWVGAGEKRSNQLRTYYKALATDPETSKVLNAYCRDVVNAYKDVLNPIMDKQYQIRWDDNVDDELQRLANKHSDEYENLVKKPYADMLQKTRIPDSKFNILSYMDRSDAFTEEDNVILFKY